MIAALRKLAFAPVLVLLLAGCESAFGINDDIEGYYSYGGTVTNSPGYSVNGDLYITGQYRDEAEADIDWYMYEGGTRILHIAADRVPVDVDSDGRIQFRVTGDLQLSSGRWTYFELRHEGRVSGRTIRGSWWLDTDIPSDDRGSFTASR